MNVCWVIKSSSLAHELNKKKTRTSKRFKLAICDLRFAICDLHKKAPKINYYNSELHTKQK